MTRALERAVAALARFLDEHHTPYMLIGGIANLVWGQPRATLDVDVSVLVEEEAWPRFVAEVGRVFHIIPTHALEFLRDTHVLPVETRDEVRIDIVWAQLPYEHRAIARATLEDVLGHRVRVCRAEDLIIHKIVSERLKDREDVRAIIRHQGARLDRQYLTRTVSALARTLHQPELLAFLTACFRNKS